MKEKQNIFLCGDIHGEFVTFGYLIKERYKIKNSYIFQLGDFGMGFYTDNYYSQALQRLDEKLQEDNNHLFVFRGNHDSPVYFQQTNNPFECKNITFLKDYSELNLLGLNLLIIGGAISIDRQDRVEGRSYWKDEVFIFDETFDFSKKKYDVVLTHTRPKSCGAFKGFLNISDWLRYDKTLKDDLIKESETVDIVYQKTRPQHWYYGHFHESNLLIHENTTFRCLDINEFYMIDHDKLLLTKEQTTVI